MSLTITPEDDAPTGSVTIAGTPSQAQTLTAPHTLADADGLGTISYQWKANGYQHQPKRGTRRKVWAGDRGRMGASQRFDKPLLLQRQYRVHPESG